MNSENDTCGNIVRELREAGCCYRCVLRYVGQKNVNFRSEIEVETKVHEYEQAQNEIQPEPKPKKARFSGCTACLGVLTDLCSEESLGKIKESIHAAKFQFSDFLLALTVPASFLIRERWFILHLKEEFADFKEDSALSIKEVWKWIVGPSVEEEFKVAFSVTSSFDINVTVEFSDDLQECERILSLIPDKIRKRRKAGSGYKAVVERALSSLAFSDLSRYLTWPPSLPSRLCQYESIVCKSKPLYLAGRYNKFSRELSQTPWLLDGEKLMKSSVKEQICDTLTRQIAADDVVFSASGREDVDVRTLGKGRPFVLEFVNPRRRIFNPKELATFQKEINDSTTDVAVRDLQVVLRDELCKLKQGEEVKTKIYSSLCFSRSTVTAQQLAILNKTQDLAVLQKTPVRVLHRRPLAVRKKMIHEMNATLVDCHHFRLTLKTQAGTYVKEFVHGDFGRTSPSVGTLLNCETDILELDVEAVELDWPPQITEKGE